MKINFKVILLTAILAFVNTNVTAKQNIKENLQNIETIYKEIKNYYVDEIEDKKAFDNAIKGMVRGLDDHSEYFTPEELSKFHEASQGEFGGIGIVISKRGDFIEIIAPIDDTPGYRNGLQRGDLIIEINGQNTVDMHLTEAVKLMRGKPGTEVEITIFRENVNTFKLKITREIITIKSIKGYLLEKDIAYIRISAFQLKTHQMLEKTIKELQAKNKSNLKGIILDVRDNPGGLLASAIKITDLFIDGKHIIVSTKGKIKNINYYSSPGDITDKAIIVTLINKGSASASEILAGALQDLKRSLIMGSKSYGKGSVQTSIPLQNGYGLKLTTAYFYTSLGNIIQKEGITPDVIFEENEEADINKNKNEENIDTEDNLQAQESELKTNTTNLKEKEIILIQNKIKEKNNKEKIQILKQQDIIKAAIKYLKNKI